MLRQIKSSGLVAITIGVVMSCSAPAFAQTVELYEKFDNIMIPETTAYDLEKILWGTYADDIADDSIICPELPICSDVNLEGFTIIHCTAGPQGPGVLSGGTAELTFELETDDPQVKVDVLCAIWTDRNNDFLGYAGSGTTLTAENQLGSVKVKIRHTGNEFNVQTGKLGSPLGIITGRLVHYSTADQQRTTEDLNENLWTCHYNGTLSPEESCETNADCTSESGGNCGPSDIDWIDLNPNDNDVDFTINHNDVTAYDLGEHTTGQVVLFRFDAEGVVPDPPPPGGRGTATHRELFQFRVPAPIPAVSAWGMVVIALLVLAAGTIVIRRRRAMAAQA